ncbi:NAD-dependent epimerase/dehydratase family protein [Actinophytocola sediminis]
MNSHQPSRVLVTGAAGRFGRVVLADLAARGVPVVGIDRVPAGPGATEKFLVGNASDVELVRAALAGVDTVYHLAAIPTPTNHPGAEVFTGNTAATFVVLAEAARAGVRRAVIASSLSITGLPFGPRTLVPPYLPIDESTPLQVADPYALSKQADEATAAMIALRDGMTVTPLRFPYLVFPDSTEPAELAELFTVDPAAGLSSLWAYLDSRDAAEACWLAATVPLAGCRPMYLAAPETLTRHRTEDLLDRLLPTVPRRGPLPGRTVPIALTMARTLLGFAAEHDFPGVT